MQQVLLHVVAALIYLIPLKTRLDLRGAIILKELLRAFARQKYFLIFLADDAAMMFEKRRRDLHEILQTISGGVMMDALLVEPEAGKPESLLKQVLEKDWGDNRKQVTDHLPALLVIDRTFADFDPCADRWAVISLADLHDASGNFDYKLSTDFVRFLLHAVRSERNLFDELAAKRQSDKLAELGECIEIQPGIFGFRFDVKRFVRSFA